MEPAQGAHEVADHARGEPGDIYASLILPVRCDAHRLGLALRRVGQYLHSVHWKSEVLLVDDASDDGTAESAARWTRYLKNLVVVRHGEPQGRGAAARTGMLVARGTNLVVLDRDLQAPLADVSMLLEHLELGADVASASHRHPGADLDVPRSFLERASETTMMALSRLMLPIGVHDPRWELLAMRRSSGRAIAQRSRVRGDAFTAEWLALTRWLGLRLVEMPLSWIEEGAPVKETAGSELAMLRDLWRIRKRLRKQDSVKPVPAQELLHDTRFVRLDRSSLVRRRR